jgi:protein ImuA
MEVFPDTAVDACATGFVLTQIPRRGGPILWAQDRLSRYQTGQPYLAGLNTPLRVLHAQLKRPADVLWALEEGLRCSGLSGVIGEIWGDPAVLDFTASKRLALRAEANGIPVWLIRRSCAPNLSAARERWRIAALPSSLHPDDPQAPGQPRWRVELFRSRLRKPGIWTADYDRATHRLRFSERLSDGPAADHGETHPTRAVG